VLAKSLHDGLVERAAVGEAPVIDDDGRGARSSATASATFETTTPTRASSVRARTASRIA
jgi:hypothetical protein